VFQLLTAALWRRTALVNHFDGADALVCGINQRLGVWY
jgi:hypothetical protein